LIGAIGGVDRGPQFIERLLNVCADPLLLNLQRSRSSSQGRRPVLASW